MTGIGHNGGPAYPCKTYTQSGHPNGESMGMSLRDYFAGQALAGFLASWPENGRPANSDTAKGVAERCYEMADAMIAAREATP